jgi:hypothetical protein
MAVDSINRLFQLAISIYVSFYTDNHIRLITCFDSKTRLIYECLKYPYMCHVTQLFVCCM